MAFGAVMAVVLGATGAFLYLRLERELDDALSQGLRNRADVVTALVRQAGDGLSKPGQNGLKGSDQSFAQVLDPSGRVLDASPGVQRIPLLTPSESARALRSTVLVPRRRPARNEDPARLLATPVDAQDRRLIVIVGASLEQRENALTSLRNLLLLGLPAALLLASGAGYALAAAVLRPVESMRRRASVISAGDPGRRLPAPQGNDEISRLGHTLNEMLERLESALARERAFVADASHELRTPLSIVKAELELALARGRSPAELRAAIASAVDETDRLAALAEDLLIIARSDQGRLPVRRDAVDVSELLARMAARFSVRATSTGRAIECAARPGLHVEADPLRLEQALANLVDNALRYGKGTISLHAEHRDGRIELRIRDQGPGFPAGFVDRAFERFSRADPARGRGGTGLGLAIVEVIARVHGGRAWAVNVPHSGAEVRLSLPIVAQHGVTPPRTTT